MKQALVIMAHPNAASFSHALAQAVSEALLAEGYDVVFHDLYVENFDPVLRPDESLTTREEEESAFLAGADPLVTTHRRDLAVADTLVIAHPNWWGKPPAILAGWMDRVLAPGVVYRLERAAGEPESLLPLRRLIVLNTGDTDPERESTVFGDPLDAIWRRCVGGYLGNATVTRVTAGPMAGATTQQRERWLEAARRSIHDPVAGETEA